MTAPSLSRRDFIVGVGAASSLQVSAMIGHELELIDQTLNELIPACHRRNGL